MMSNMLIVQRFLIGACLICLSCILGGCGPREEWIFSEDIMAETGKESDAGKMTDISVQSDLVDTGIVVYLCGAIKNPGVIVLPKGSRMNDAVQAAGGFTEEADRTAVNLAARLADEDMIYVPTKEENAGVSTPQSDNGLININTADVYTLCRLPGIGESKARDIIGYREEKGAFRKKEDIMQVDGIKENLYKQICDLISVK